MLKLIPAPTFEFDAQITVPGQVEPAVLRLTAKHRGREGLQMWIKSSKEDVSDVQFLGTGITGWAGVLDETGADVPFSTQAFGQVLEAYGTAGAEIFQQYVAALTESRRKN